MSSLQPLHLHLPHHYAFRSLESITENESDESQNNVYNGPGPSEMNSEKLPVLLASSSSCSSSRLSTPRSSFNTRSAVNQAFTAADQLLSDPVQGTTEDASISKLSSITAGYYEDPYCYHVVRHPAKRSPLINRGYYSRVAAMRKVLSTFLNSIPADIPTVQVVNIGAGLDTTYFWVSDFWSTPGVIFYEIDFLEVLQKKASLFAKKEPLRIRLQQMKGHREFDQIEDDLKEERATPINDTLYFIPADIKDIDLVELALRSAGFSGKLPTLFISECSLIYLSGTYSDQIISWAANITVAPSAFVIYEQANPYDTFGKTMVKNLELRGCPLLGIHDYPTLTDQRCRFLTLGWDRVTIEDMHRIYDHFLDKFELVRIQNLELLDELEEWRLIQQHYFVAVAVKGKRNDNENSDRPTNDLGYLTELSTIWDAGRELVQDMPRFTTAELRSKTDPNREYHGNIGVELLLTSRSQPKLCPGTLSPLMCPQGASGLLPPLSLGGSIPMGKWSLPQIPRDSSDSDLQSLTGFSGRSSNHPGSWISSPAGGSVSEEQRTL